MSLEREIYLLRIMVVSEAVMLFAATIKALGLL